MSYITFYNQQGRAIAWVGDNQDYMSVFLYDGSPVAWISNESVYAYSGRHLGFIQDGWVRDHNGHAVFFTDDASGGPAKPARQARPARGSRGARPARGARQARPAKAARITSWSPLSDESFFRQ